MTRVVSQYIDDDGRTTYNVTCPAGWIGFPTHPWGPGDGLAHPPIPSGIRMRVVTCVNASGQHRNIPIQNPATWLSGIPLGHVFSMPTNSGTFENWTVIGKIAQSYAPKKYRARRRRW